MFIQPPLHILSLGAGVQSSTLALIAAAGGYGPMPSAAVFADTQDEPKEVYDWLDWLEKQLPYPVYRVTAGKLSDAATRIKLSKKSGNTYTQIGLPVYTTQSAIVRPLIGEDENDEAIYGEPMATIKKGMGMRQCTRTFKIDPIRRKCRELAKGRRVIQWIGISTDEASRMKPSRDKWCDNIWPLIEMNMSRKDCLKWMLESGYPKPPRSACTYCPYHNDAEWMRMKGEHEQMLADEHDGKPHIGPSDWQKAVAFELRLQKAYVAATALKSFPYLHSSRKPLAEVVFTAKAKEPDMFNNECEGMCGV